MERHGQRLRVVERPPPQIEQDRLADAPAAQHEHRAQPTGDDRARHERNRDRDEGAVLAVLYLGQRAVDGDADQPRSSHRRAGLDQHDRDDERDGPPVRPDEFAEQAARIAAQAGAAGDDDLVGRLPRRLGVLGQLAPPVGGGFCRLAHRCGSSSEVCASSSRYSGTVSSNSRCVPTAAMRPSASNATRSASSTVEGRWATTSAVVRGQHAPQRRLDLRLRLHVQRGERIVEDEHPRAAEHRAGEREPLALPTGQRQALLADPGVEPVGQVVDEAGLRDVDRLGDVGVGDAGPPERQILGHARGEQRRLLERHRHDAAQFVEGQVTHVASADGDRPAGDVVEAGDQCGQRRLAGAGRAHERHGLAVADLQVDAVQHVVGRVRVPEPHVVEPNDRVGHPIVGHRRVDDRGIGVEHVEDAPRRTCRLLGEREQPAQRDDRPDKAQVQGQERDELTQRHRAVRSGQHTTARDAGQHELRLPFERGPELGQRPDLGHLRLAQDAGALGERREHLRTAAVGLDDADAQRGLLDRGGEVAGEVLGPPGVAAVAQLEAPGEDGEWRDRHDDEQPEHEVNVQQQHENHERGCGVRDQEDEAESDEAPDAWTGRWWRARATGPRAIGRGTRPAAAAGGRTGRGACRSRARARRAPWRNAARRTARPRRCRTRAPARRAARYPRCRGG